MRKPPPASVEAVYLASAHLCASALAVSDGFSLRDSEGFFLQRESGEWVHPITGECFSFSHPRIEDAISEAAAKRARSTRPAKAAPTLAEVSRLLTPRHAGIAPPGCAFCWVCRAESGNPSLEGPVPCARGLYICDLMADRRTASAPVVAVSSGYWLTPVPVLCSSCDAMVASTPAAPSGDRRRFFPTHASESSPHDEGAYWWNR